MYDVICGSNRNRLAEAIKPTVWHPVRRVVLDEVWSALWFRRSVQSASKRAKLLGSFLMITT